MFLALAGATACRSSEICLLNVNYMIRKKQLLQFFGKLTKTWRKCKPASSLDLLDFPETSELCLVLRL